MSRTALNEVLDRSLLDEEFRRAILADPDATLAEYDLTDAERAALAKRDVDEATKLAGRSPSAAIVVVNISTINTFITSIVNLTNLIAVRPEPEDHEKARIRRRSEEIKRMEGDRTESIKELLGTLW